MGSAHFFLKIILDIAKNISNIIPWNIGREKVRR